MRKSNKILVSLVVLAIMSIGFGAIATGRAVDDKSGVQDRIISLGKNDNRVMEHLYHLTDHIGPRPNGSENLEMACQWARDELMSFGLTNVHLERCPDKPTTLPVGLVRDLIDVRGRLYNVVADIPGTELPDEYVIVGAHIDSDDAGTGAADNGAGVAAAMEAARILMESGAQPKRTVRFILFSGEEIGKVGSGAYVENHPDLMPRVSVMLNMDQGSDHISGIYATPAMMEDFEKVFAPVKSLDPRMPFAAERVQHLTDIIKDCCGSAGTSDHGSFFEAGVPAFAWLQKAKSPTRYRPHTRYDTYENVNPEYLKHSATAIALSAFGIAELDNMLSRENAIAASRPLARGSACCPSTPPTRYKSRRGGACCPSGSDQSKSSIRRSSCCPSSPDSAKTPKFKIDVSRCCPSGSASSKSCEPGVQPVGCCRSASKSSKPI
jgi:hypothetical protein